MLVRKEQTGNLLSRVTSQSGSDRHSWHQAVNPSCGTEFPLPYLTLSNSISESSPPAFSPIHTQKPPKMSRDTTASIDTSIKAFGPNADTPASRKIFSEIPKEIEDQTKPKDKLAMGGATPSQTASGEAPGEKGYVDSDRLPRDAQRKQEKSDL